MTVRTPAGRWRNGLELRFESQGNRRDTGYRIDDYNFIKSCAGLESNWLSTSGYAENIGGRKQAIGYDVNDFLAGHQAAIRPEIYGVRPSFRD